MFILLLSLTILNVMRLAATLLFAAAVATATDDLGNLGPEWEPVDVVDGAEADIAHRALGGGTKLLSCRRKCDGSKKGREIKICEYLVDGKYEVKKWEYWSKRSVCWGGSGRDPWSSSSSSSSSSDDCREEKKDCKEKCRRRLLGEVTEERALGSKSSKSSTSSGSSGKGKGGSKLSAKSSKSSKSEDKESRSHAGGKENRGNTGNDQGGNTGDDGHRELGSSSCKKQCKKKFRKCKRGH